MLLLLFAFTWYSFAYPGVVLFYVSLLYLFNLGAFVLQQGNVKYLDLLSEPFWVASCHLVLCFLHFLSFLTFAP